ncbi:MAG: TonB-dependent receptor [Roseivirga sp.]|nr:TonB-dependent receptor [Roseivirga sp.]
MKFLGLKWLLVLVIFGMANGVFAQDGECDLVLRGTVLDKENKLPVPFATIEIPSLGKRIVSSSDGSFSFDQLCAVNHELTFRFLGYKTLTQSFSLPATIEVFKIYLETDVKDLSKVVVEGEKVEEIASLKRAELSGDALTRSNGESLGQALTNITGVNILQTGPTIAKPVIHGLHSNRILILNNGIRQEGQQWGQEHAPEIDPFVATNLQLIKGAAAVKYGSDAIGGVILVNPPDLPSSSGIAGSFNLVGASNNKLGASSLMLEGGIAGLPGFGWRVQGSLKRGGDARAADYRLTNTGTKEDNFSFGLGYHKEGAGFEVFYSSFDADIAILRSAHIGNLTDLENAIGRDRPLFIDDFSRDINNPRQQVAHQLLKVNSHVDINNLGELYLQYGLQRNQRKEFDIRRGGRSNIPALSLDLITHTLELDLDLAPMGKWKGDIGASFLMQANENATETGIRPLIPNFDNLTAGFHVIGRYVEDKYELEFGLRYDYKHYLVKKFDENNVLIRPEFDFNNITGSAGVVLNLSNGWELRSNLGTAWRAPHVNELFSEGLHHGSAAIEEGRDDLVSEKAIKWISSIEKNTARYSIDISAYYNLINDYIYLRPEDVALTIRGAFPIFRYNQTDAHFLGLDANLSYALTDALEWTNKLSLIRAKDRTVGSPLINIPANRLESGITYKFDEGRLRAPFLSVSADFVDRQRNAPRVISIADVRVSETDLFATDQSIFDFLEAPVGYVNLNISGGFKTQLFSNELNVFVSVENLLNNSYRDYLNRFRYYADDLGRNISLKINYNF